MKKVNKMAKAKVYKLPELSEADDAYTGHYTKQRDEGYCDAANLVINCFILITLNSVLKTYIFKVSVEEVNFWMLKETIRFT